MEGNQISRYMVVDSRQIPLAKAVLESAADAVSWQIRVLDDRVDQVLKHEVVQLISLSENTVSLLGRIVRSRGNRVVIERLGELGADVRENLRIPIRFDSFIYPLTGTWTGRRRVIAHDISCGGIAFFCSDHLDDQERVEIVISVTSRPVILTAEVIRARNVAGSAPLYATRFADLIDDEETIVREAVFDIQLQTRADRREKGTILS